MNNISIFDFLVNNWAVIFSGIGTAIIVAIGGSWFKKNKNQETKPNQNAQAGSNSIIIQGGRDVRYKGSNEKPCKKASK